MARPKNPIRRDKALARLKDITDIACRFAMELLPERPVDPFEAAMVRKQRVAVNGLQAEAEELLRGVAGTAMVGSD